MSGNSVKMFALYLSMFVVSVVEGKKSYSITGPVWKNDIYSCASSGEYENTNTFALPDMKAIGLNYEEIDGLTTVIGYFNHMEGHTKAVENADINHLWLNEYKDGGTFKEFTGRWGYTAICGWGKQATFLRLVLTFKQNGTVDLKNYVYAASWGAVTCATTKSHVGYFTIIN